MIFQRFVVKQQRHSRKWLSYFFGRRSPVLAIALPQDVDSKSHSGKCMQPHPMICSDRDENPQADLAFQPLADEDSEDDFFTQRFRRTSSGRVGGVSSDTESDSDDEPPRQRRRTVLEEDDE